MKKWIIGLICSLALLFGVVAPVTGLQSLTPASYAENQNYTVMFNTNSFKFHKPSCQWAQRCTANCIPIKRSEAVSRGGVPCKVCGG